MRIILAVPEDETVLGVIGSYCKAGLEALNNEVLTFDFRKHPYSQNRAMRFLKSAFRAVFPYAPSPYELLAIKSASDNRINQRLLDYAASFRPGLLLVLCGENILPDTLSRIKSETGALTANWFYDTLISPLRQNLVSSTLPHYDYLFIMDSPGVLKEIGANIKNAFTLPLACQPSVHKRIELSNSEVEKYGSDVAFVGTLSPQRQKILEELSGFNLKIWGRWKNKSYALRSAYRDKDVYAEEAVKIYNASKITLDIHSLFGQGREIYNVTPRLFEVPASGGFLLTNFTAQVSDFYKIGEEIAVYRDAAELKNLVAYYLEHPAERAAMADKAYRRAHSEHTYANRLTKLLGVIKEGFNKADR